MAVLMALAIANPEAALVVTIVLFVAITTIVLFQFVRRLWRA